MSQKKVREKVGSDLDGGLKTKWLTKFFTVDIIGVNIPTSVPLIYEFDTNFKVIKSYYLGN